MNAKIQNWGNSLALRIPKAFAKESHLTTGSVVDLTVDNGKLVVDLNPEPEYSLKDLLKKVTKTNLHSEADTGKVVGKEVW